MKFKSSYIFLILLISLSGVSGPGPAAEKLEEKFYNDFLDGLPNPESGRQELLEKNFLRILKIKLPDYDSKNGKRYVKTLSSREFSYRRITEESKFTRGIFKELPQLKPTDYMWIIKSGPYLVLLTFLADPGLYIVDQSQIEVIIENRSEPGHT